MVPPGDHPSHSKCCGLDRARLLPSSRSLLRQRSVRGWSKREASRGNHHTRNLLTHSFSGRRHCARRESTPTRDLPAPVQPVPVTRSAPSGRRSVDHERSRPCDGDRLNWCGEVPDGSRFSTRTAVSYTHLRAHETDSYLVCRLLLEKK